MESNLNLEQQLSQYRIIKEQKEIFQGQFEILSASRASLYTIMRTLENIREGVNEDDEILIPIGGRVSIKGSIKDTQKVLVFVQNDTAIEMNVAEAIDYIDKQIENHNNQLQYLQERIFNLELNLQSMNQSLQNRMNQP